MSTQVVLDRDGVTITFGDPVHDRKGWLESYSVSLVAGGLSAAVRVENPPYGSDPSRFFAELAKSWRGWHGEKEWSSMEGELDLAGVTDSLGHITITVRVRPDAYPATWSAKVSVMVEAGQLEQLHQQFLGFFAVEPQPTLQADAAAQRGLS